jgi:hypothetical protein
MIWPDAEEKRCIGARVAQCTRETRHPFPRSAQRVDIDLERERSFHCNFRSPRARF